MFVAVSLRKIRLFVPVFARAGAASRIPVPACGPALRVFRCWRVSMPLPRPPKLIDAARLKSDPGSARWQALPAAQ